MKIRILGLCLLLAMIGLSSGSTSLTFAANTSVWPTPATPGTRVYFNADGFTPGERVDFWVSFPDGGTVPRYPSVKADEKGAVVWSWDVPAGTPNGNYSMSARGIDSDQRITIPFSVTGSTALPAQISVTPASAAPGATFNFQAGGLTPRGRIGAWLVDPAGGTHDLVAGEDPNLYADGDGNLSWSWTSPADAAGGGWQMVIRDRDTSKQLQVSFTIAAPPKEAPARSITPTSGAPGTRFTVYASGFTPGEEVGSWLNRPDGQRVDATPYMIANDQGAVTWSWDSPTNAMAGTWQAVTRGRTSNVEVVLSFTLGGSNPAPAGPTPASGTIWPPVGEPGTTFTITVQGFDRTEKLGFWATRPDGTPEPVLRDDIYSDGDGKATFTWQAPRLAANGAWLANIRGTESDLEVAIPFTIGTANPIQGSVTPERGAPGTTFSFRVIGLNVIEYIDTWLELPDGSMILGPKKVQADGNGVAKWDWTAPDNAIGGKWTMVVRGQDTKLVYRIPFTIDRDAPPPAATSVTPQRGGIGTTFTFTAGGFLEGERVGYWLNRPDGSIEQFDVELVADEKGNVTWTYTVPAGAPRGLYVMALRSSQSDKVEHDVSYTIRFTVE